MKNSIPNTPRDSVPQLKIQCTLISPVNLNSKVSVPNSDIKCTYSPP